MIPKKWAGWLTAIMLPVVTFGEFAVFCWMPTGIVKTYLLLGGIFFVGNWLLVMLLPDPKQYDRRTKTLLILFEIIVFVFLVVDGLVTSRMPENSPDQTAWMTILVYLSLGWLLISTAITQKYRKDDDEEEDQP